MRCTILLSIGLLLSFLGATCKPMWQDGEGSSSAPRPWVTGFDWQGQALEPPPSTPRPKQGSQSWHGHPAVQGDFGYQHGGDAHTSGAAGAVVGRPSWQGHVPLVDLTTSPASPVPRTESTWSRQGTAAVAQQQAGSNVALIPATAPQPAPVQHVTHEEWQENMRKALRNPSLVFINTDKQYPIHPRLFIAYNPTNPTDLHLMSSPQQGQPSLSAGKKHFLINSEAFIKLQSKSLPLGHTRLQTMVYLNSQSNMDFISREYFQGKMHFLPINIDKVMWRRLNLLLTDRSHLYLAPPLEKHGLGLLLGMHRNGQRVNEIEEMTGPVTSRNQIVTIWSPILLDGSRTTVVFYGVGQLDATELEKTQQHLANVASRWSGVDPFWDAVYYLKSLPKDFALLFYPKDYESPELKKKAELRLENAIRYLHPE